MTTQPVAGAALDAIVVAANRALEDLTSLQRILQTEPQGSTAWKCGNLAWAAAVDLFAALRAHPTTASTGAEGVCGGE